eukprot:jgi/Botrbrau1/544/Bobra.0010s0019.1
MTRHTRRKHSVSIQSSPSHHPYTRLLSTQHKHKALRGSTGRPYFPHGSFASRGISYICKRCVSLSHNVAIPGPVVCQTLVCDGRVR